jgi:hypothetical protein
LFAVVNLINKGNNGQQDRPEFASLNLRAAEKSLSIVAFSSAAIFASNGIKFLPCSKWTTHRDLTLRLYSIGAEMEFALGNLDAMEDYSSAVLSLDDATILEKFPLYMTRFHRLSTTDLKHNQAIKLGLAVLKELGCDLIFCSIALPVQAFASLMQTIRMAKKTPKDVYKNMTPIIDPKHEAIMLLLFRIGYTCHFSGSNHLLHILCITRNAQMVLKHGVSGPLSGKCMDIFSLVVPIPIRSTDAPLLFVVHFSRSGVVYFGFSSCYHLR